MEERGASRHLVVARNRIADIAKDDNRPGAIPIGIDVRHTEHADVIDNIVEGVGTAAGQAAARAGIQATVLAICGSAAIVLRQSGRPARSSTRRARFGCATLRRSDDYRQHGGAGQPPFSRLVNGALVGYPGRRAIERARSAAEPSGVQRRARRSRFRAPRWR